MENSETAAFLVTSNPPRYSPYLYASGLYMEESAEPLCYSPLLAPYL